uniref:Uncharacterized protein n=1 Tax=Meloidogyne incognita TaxID=6306 RepID=A0A914NQG1_MELIC
MILGTFIGHVLLLERILATVFVSKYENNKKPYFSIFCFIIVNFLSFDNAFQQTYGDSVLNVTLGTLITLFGTLFLGLVEIALSENIRTSRQLKPTFVLHFVNILVSSGITISLYFFNLKDSSTLEFIFAFVFLITAFCNLFIEITIIIFHPILNIHLKLLLKKFQKEFLKIYPSKVGTVETFSSTGGIPLNIDGSILIINECTELSQKHFEMLKQLWR